MIRLILCALLGGLSLAAPAQTTPDQEVRIRGYQIELPIHKHVMSRGDFEKYAGDYMLSNGSMMTLTRDDRRLYATINHGERKELVASKGNEFVALDRDLKIRLDREDITDDFGGEVWMVVDRDLAQGKPGLVIRLASLR